MTWRYCWYYMPENVTVPLIKQCTTYKDVKNIFIFGRMPKLLEKPFCFMWVLFWKVSSGTQCGAERQLLSLPLWVASRINQKQIIFRRHQRIFIWLTPDYSFSESDGLALHYFYLHVSWEKVLLHVTFWALMYRTCTLHLSWYTL